MDPVAEVLFKQIVSKRKKISEFPLSIRSFTATLLFLPPKAYAYARKVFSLVLPHPSTIRKWFMSIDGTPGICKPALQELEGKLLLAQKKGKALLCSMTVDDMAIRKHVRWNGKRYVGFVSDTNDSNGKSKNTVMTTQAMVVMIVCLNENWKIPMSYYLINSLNGKERAQHISQCLTNLHEIGINVTSLTFDGAQSNIRMAKELGAEFNFTEKASIHFPHPVTKEPIFVIIDACHAIKLIRNTLAQRKVLYNSKGDVIEWKYFQLLVRLQYQYGLHLGTKIRKRHLNWAQEKMKVKLATQTFSASTAHALNVLRCDIKHPDFIGSEATEKFCFIMNNSFDLLNSRQKVVKVPSKQCINKNNIVEIRSNIQLYEAYISILRDGDKPIFESKRKMGFFGIVNALENVVAIFDKWSTSETAPLEYLLTYKLSQDHLELFFSAVRARNGNNNNPSPEQFESSFKWLLVYAQIGASTNANCILQDSTCLLQTPKVVLDKPTSRTENVKIVNIHKSSETLTASSSITLDHNYCIPSVFSNVNITYINHVVAYIAGFIAKSLSKSVKCVYCVKSLKSEKSFSTLQTKKCQGRVTKASVDLIQVCLISEQRFRAYNVF
ncbi:THAP domain-containing protein 9 [Trachymyrmex zeteki]|uniref:THAP domain-containing protein 9 n=1 Tax=Mycetomoellerius zeteki TaxID=64791 RepID=A0A151X5G2_9HYME|nr:THAP domain-containing protein 9 [Trachymyrmex zeteki]